MSTRYYLCAIYGDGNIDVPDTPTTGPYRPSINDVVDPVTGSKAFITRFVIGSNPTTGAPLHPWAIVAAEGSQHDLVDGDPDITPIADQGVQRVKLAALHIPTRNAIFAAMQGRGISTSRFDVNSSVRDVLDHMIQEHDAALNADALDIPV